MDSTAASAASNQGLYIGLGCGIGGLLLLTIAVVCFLIVRKIRQHKRATSLLEQGQSTATVTVEQRSSHDIRNSITLGRRSSLMNSRSGWDALSSTDTIDQQVKDTVPPVHIPKKNKKYGIQLKRLKHLSAITESPRSRNGQSPVVPTIRKVDEASILECQQADYVTDEAKPIGCAQTADFAIRPGEDILDKHISALGLKLLVQPSTVPVDENKPKPPRSVSLGALLGPITHPMAPTGRPRMHVRSVSLGGQPPEHLPPDPARNFPVIAPHDPDAEQRRISQGTMSSQDSASSSVLVNSPFMVRSTKEIPTTPRAQCASPEPTAARLFPLNTNNMFIPEDYQSPPVSPLSDRGMDLKRELPSSSSISSFDDDTSTTSFRRVTGLNQPSKSRVSPGQSGRTLSGGRTTLARRASKSSVSATGSPTERKRPGILRDISGNSLIPSRRLSNAASTNSSENNPFQWDTLSQKPSAMKGSPNSKKGHKRQHCVRISTLTPQVLGPPPSRSTSPSITHRIDEESGDEMGRRRDDTRFVTNRRPSRPLSGVALAPSLRVQTLRASLTPSSPTLSMWAAYQDHLPSQASDSHLTVSTGNNSRPGSRLSSSFSIPSFPSPSRTTTSDVHMAQPTPEFCVAQPSPDSMKATSSPFDLYMDSDMTLSSSPPVLSPSTKLYDPALPPMPKFDMASLRKYDPAGPLAPQKLFATPPPQDRAATLSDLSSSNSTRRAGDEIVHQSGSTASLSPPLFQERSHLRPTSPNVLTSHNASSIMAQMPLQAFPGAPVLSPPRDDNPVPLPLWVKRSVSPEEQVQRQSVTSHREDSPSRVGGPRTEPPKSVLQNAIALRRMNSEVDTSYCRESRRYVQLGRENSLVLPLYSNPNLGDSCNDLFDFGFDSHRDLDAGSGALESLGIVSGSIFSREASSFYHDLPTITEIQQYIEQEEEEESRRKGGRKRHAVTLDIDNPWREALGADKSLHTDADNSKGEQGSSAVNTPKMSDRRHLSVMETPQSLYGADGFLRSDC